MLEWLRDRMAGRQPRPVPVPWPEHQCDVDYWCLVITLDEWNPTQEQLQFWHDWRHLGRSRGLVRIADDRYELPCATRGTATYWAAVLDRWCGMGPKQVRYFERRLPR